jgi:hypothetical protein
MMSKYSNWDTRAHYVEEGCWNDWHKEEDCYREDQRHKEDCHKREECCCPPRHEECPKERPIKAFGNFYKQGSQVVNANTDIVFTAATQRENTSLNTGNASIDVKLPSDYLINAVVRTRAAVDGATIAIAVNGVPAIETKARVFDLAPSETSITTILKLAAGDDISIRVLNAAITLAEQDVNTMLTIVRVG